MPGLDPKQTKSLFKRIADSGETVNYALGLGAKPETSSFLVHKSKKASALESELKKEGGYKKVGFGCLEVRDGQVILAETRPVAHADKLLRQLFKAHGLKAFAPIFAEQQSDEAEPGTDAADDTARAERRADRAARIAGIRADLDRMMRRLGA